MRSKIFNYFGFVGEVKEDVVPINQKIGFSLGLVGDHYAIQNINLIALIVYNVMLGVEPAIVGAILAITRIWDALTDSFFGNYSDNSRSHKGRRRPYMLFGAVMTALFLQVIWFVPENLSDIATSAYFLVALLLFYTFYTLYSVSYESLGLELSPDYDERNRLFAFRDIIRAALGLGIPWMAAAIYWDVFESPLQGARFVGMIVGILLVFCAVTCYFSCPERYNELSKSQKKIPFIKSIKLLRNNIPLIIVVLMASLNLFAIMINSSLGFYINSYYLYEGDISSATILGGYSGTLSIVGASLGAVLSFYLSKKVDKLASLRASLVGLIFSTLIMWVTFTPDNPYLSLTTHAFSGACNSIFWISLLSMRADICDWDEKHSFSRREGLIAGVISWMSKLGMSLGLLFGGLMLSISGFNIDDTTTYADSLVKIKIFYVFVPMTLFVFCFWLSLRYSLNRGKSLETRYILESRRGLA